MPLWGRESGDGRAVEHARVVHEGRTPARHRRTLGAPLTIWEPVPASEEGSRRVLVRASPRQGPPRRASARGRPTGARRRPNKTPKVPTVPPALRPRGRGGASYPSPRHLGAFPPRRWPGGRHGTVGARCARRTRAAIAPPPPAGGGPKRIYYLSMLNVPPPAVLGVVAPGGRRYVRRACTDRFPAPWRRRPAHKHGVAPSVRRRGWSPITRVESTLLSGTLVKISEKYSARSEIRRFGSEFFLERTFWSRSPRA